MITREQFLCEHCQRVLKVIDVRVAGHRYIRHFDWSNQDPDPKFPTATRTLCPPHRQSLLLEIVGEAQ